MRRRLQPLGIAFSLAVMIGACAGDAEVIGGDEPGDNPFLADPAGGKEDSQYLNPDGIEVEIDVEADIEAPAWKMRVAPGVLAQYAMTWLRAEKILYLESVAEDASSADRVEWFIDGEWKPSGEVETLEGDARIRFRIRGMNAVILNDYDSLAEVGKALAVQVPVRPFAIMEEAGDRCATPDNHITLSQSVYWYLWNPERAGCDAELQPMSLTVSKVLPGEDSYPEYDRLVADGKITGVVLFGQIGDDMSPSDPGFRNLDRMARNLEWADYEEVDAPLGRRFTKTVAGVVIEIDLYSPNEFSGLSDHANFPNFQKAIAEHEIVAYDGHSMLGASDFWAKPEYPDSYQIFLYGGCLGYEYYVRPIVDGKQGWGNVDIVSSVIEVSADANYYAGPVFAKLETALQNEFDVSWRSILLAIRHSVGDSTFGASGVRENCFTPDGSRCEAPVVVE